jgi:hypothetical protein
VFTSAVPYLAARIELGELKEQGCQGWNEFD